MLDETRFHPLADAFLSALFEQIEAADQGGVIDAEYQGGILTLELENGKTLVVSKHAPSLQIWLSSPISGGLHFRHENGDWKLPDGRELKTMLAAELKQLSGVEIA